MVVREHIPLSELTTLRVGGLARYVCTCASVDDVAEAVALAEKEGIPFRVLGEGSNVLALDSGYSGVIITMSIPGVSYIESGECELVTVGAGVAWDELVRDVADRGLWGLENLAGIPGTVGAAPVQNIGAYGAELQSVFASAQVFDTATSRITEYDSAACRFEYRDSIFKHDRTLIICSVTLRLFREGIPKLGYSDLLERQREGFEMNSPVSIGENVRLVRARKFPDLAEQGTAGSFFKNPIVSQALFDSLSAKHGAVPSFPAKQGIKIPLAFILDKVLGLRGFKKGNVSLFGNQPLVLVTDTGANAKEVDCFAEEIERKVRDATTISIEREVQMLV
jgi:UDP-N-acetylmuramate dehydrogenase